MVFAEVGANAELGVQGRKLKGLEVGHGGIQPKGEAKSCTEEELWLCLRVSPTRLSKV